MGHTFNIFSLFTCLTDSTWTLKAEWLTVLYLCSRQSSTFWLRNGSMLQTGACRKSGSKTEANARQNANEPIKKTNPNQGFNKRCILICNARQSVTAKQSSRDNVQLKQMVKQSNVSSIKRCEKKKTNDTPNVRVQVKTPFSLTWTSLTLNKEKNEKMCTWEAASFVRT